MENWNRNQNLKLEMVGGDLLSNFEYVINIKKTKENFVILNLTDIQLATEELGTKRQNEIEYIVSQLVEKTKPDLITVTGDQTYFGSKPVISYLGQFIDSFCIPWAPIFGNHDLTYNSDDLNLSNDAQIELYSSFDYCLMEKGPMNLNQDGHVNVPGNYIINIYEKNNGSFEVIRSLVFVNSGDRVESKKEDYEGRLTTGYSNWSKLTDTQVEFIKWYDKEIQRYSIEKVPYTLFTHTPLFAYTKAINEAMKNPYDFFKNSDDFIKYANNISIKDSYSPLSWSEGFEESFGVFHDTCIASFRYDNFVFERLLESHIDSVIAGHDHTNNFVITYRDVILAYALKTGSGCYYHSDLSGGTKITIKKNEKPQIEHIYIDYEIR